MAVASLLELTVLVFLTLRAVSALDGSIFPECKTRTGGQDIKDLIAKDPCQFVCPVAITMVCANDGNSHLNDCFLCKAACKHPGTLIFKRCDGRCPCPGKPRDDVDKTAQDCINGECENESRGASDQEADTIYTVADDIDGISYMLSDDDNDDEDDDELYEEDVDIEDEFLYGEDQGYSGEEDGSFEDEESSEHDIVSGNEQHDIQLDGTEAKHNEELSQNHEAETHQTDGKKQDLGNNDDPDKPETIDEQDDLAKEHDQESSEPGQTVVPSTDQDGQPSQILEEDKQPQQSGNSTGEDPGQDKGNEQGNHL